MHAFANAGDEEARLRVEVRPALRMEEMFAEVVAMAEAGRMNRRGLPRNLLDLAVARPPLRPGGARAAPERRRPAALLAPLVMLARRPRSAQAARVEAFAR